MSNNNVLPIVNIGQYWTVLDRIQILGTQHSIADLIKDDVTGAYIRCRASEGVAIRDSSHRLEATQDIIGVKKNR